MKDQKFLLPFTILISIILHISIYFLFVFLIKPPKQEKKKEKIKEIYIYLPKIEKKLSDKTVKRLKLAKSEKKGNKFIKRKPVKKKVISKKIKVSKKVRKLSKVGKVKKKTTTKKIVKKVVKKEKVNKKEEKILNDNLNKTDNDNNLAKTEDNNNTTQVNRKLSISNLRGKESIFELGKKDNVEEEIKKDIDVSEYIGELNKYLNSLARRKDLYPPMAKRLRLEGSLIVRFKINRDGTVDEKSIKIIISSGYNVLDEGAIRIIKEYVPKFVRKYHKYPPKDNFIVEIPITFEIIEWY